MNRPTKHTTIVTVGLALGAALVAGPAFAATTSHPVNAGTTARMTAPHTVDLSTAADRSSPDPASRDRLSTDPAAAPSHSPVSKDPVSKDPVSLDASSVDRPSLDH